MLTKPVNRIKVLLICHFSNTEVRDRLTLRRDRVYHDFAVWITNRLAAYTDCDELELHVVAPHAGMQEKTQSFDADGIYYHFYSAGTTINKFIETGIDFVIQKINIKPITDILFQVKSLYWSISFNRQRNYVKALVQDVKPDIIHLNGAENPYYSSTVLGLKSYNIPICISIQGIVGDPAAMSVSEFNDLSRIKLENKIHSQFKYYLVGSPDHYRLVKIDNPTAVFMFTPDIRTINIDPYSTQVTKEFNFVFMSRVTPIKGIEHLLSAMRLLKQYYPKISLLVLGPVSPTYLDHLKKLCEGYGIIDRVEFAGHIPKREDLYRMVLQAEIFVLPTTFEGLATSAVEAMLLGLPVVTYATGGMPYLNKDGENVLMCKTGDIEELTKNMKRLLDDQDFANELARRGQAFAKKTFGAEENVKLNIRQYRAILDHYHEGTQFPEDLLYFG